MSDKTLSVRITATENASGVLKKVGDAASKAADELEKAGTDGARGLEKIEQEASQAAPAVERVGDSAQRAGLDLVALGAAAGTVVGAMAQLGQMRREEERQVSGIQALYGDQSSAILQMAENMQQFTRYSNDAARESALFASSLVTNYQMTADQVAVLVERSADLAQIYGVSLVDAVTRTSGALRGEGEAAERLGLNMSDAAVAARALDAGITNWNVPGALSESEKAAFRFQLFLQDTEKTVGQAAAAADNAGGGFRRLANEMQDAGQSIGGFLGPVGQVAAEMAPLSLALPLVGAGLGKVAAGMRIATTASLAFVATPIGAAVAAIGLVVGAGTMLWMDHRNQVKEAEAAYRSMMEAVEATDDAIGSLRLEDWGDAQWAENFRTNVEREMDWQGTWLRDTLLKSFGTGDDFDKEVRAVLGDLSIFQPGEQKILWENQANLMIDALIPDEGDKQRFNEAMVDLISLKGVVGDTTFDAIQDNAEILWKSFDAGTISVDELNAQLAYLYEANLKAAQSLDISSIATNQLAAEQQKWIDLGMGSVGEMTTDMNEYEEATLGSAAATRELALAERERNDQRGTYEQGGADQDDDWWNDFYARGEADREEDKNRADRRREAAEAFKQQAREGWAEYTKLHTRAAGAEIMLNQGVAASVNDVKAAYADMAAAREEELFALMTSITGMDNPLDQWNASSGASPFSQIALDATNAAEALDNMFRVIVGSTSAMADQVSGVNDWATELIGVAGEYAVIDDLLANGRITLDQYNAAQQAQIQIAEANVAVQEHVQTIQAMQAPLIAESTAALEAQLGVISEMPAQQQLVALSWMDSATAAKALEIATMATAVANGELGASGEAAFTSYLEGIAAVDPAMKALLIDMGLISEGADGTITVNMDGAEGAISDIDRLTMGITALIDLLDNGVLDGSFSLDVEDNATPTIQQVYDSLTNLDGQTATTTTQNNDVASSVIAGVQSLLNDLDGDVATTTSSTVDNSSGTLNSVSNLLNSLNGREAITYITTVNRTVSGGISAGKLQGGVPGFEQGGVTFYGGEGNRPELARFANGGVGLVPHEGYFNVPPATRIVPNNGNNYGGGGGDTYVFNIEAGDHREEMRAFVADEFLPAIEQRVRNRNIALGLNA